MVSDIYYTRVMLPIPSQADVRGSGGARGPPSQTSLKAAAEDDPIIMHGAGKPQTRTLLSAESYIII